MKNNIHLESKVPPKETHVITPSRRSWKMLSDTLKVNPTIFQNKALFKALCVGFIGIDATSKFNHHIESEGKDITAKDILENFEMHKSKIKLMHISEQNFLIEKIYEHSADEKNNAWNNSELQNIYGFYNILNKEMKMALYDKVTDTKTKFENQKNFAIIAQASIIDIYNRNE